VEINLVEPAKDGGITVVDATVAEPTSTSSVVEDLVERLVRLDADGAITIVDQLAASEVSLAAIVTDVLAPAGVALGERWLAADIGAAEVDAAIAICRRALGRVAITSRVEASHPKMAVACPEGEQQPFAAEMVSEVLRAQGWPVDLISGGVPAADLRAYLARSRPWALLLSCSTPGALAGAARAIDAAHEVEVPVLVSGTAFGHDDLRALRLGASAWAASGDAALKILDHWEAERPQLSLGRAISEEYARFEDHLPAVSLTVGDALRSTEARRHDDAADLTSVRQRVEPLLDHLAAAVLVDDGRLLLDFLSNRLRFLRARGIGGDQLAATLDAVAASLPDPSGQVARFLDDGRQHLHWSLNRGAGTRPVSSASLARTRPTGSVSADATVQPMGGPDVAQGQVFADLLFLAAMSCHAPMALISVAQPDGQWSTLSFGVDRREALNDPSFFASIADRTEPLEIPDLSRNESFSSSPLVTGPLAVRFAIGIPLRSRTGTTAGVFCVLDRRARELTKHEQQATMAIARQVTGQLVLWRRSSNPGAEEGNHPAERRKVPGRSGPDAALANLLGVRGVTLGAEQHLLRSHEVAVLFDVTERTVINWAASGKLPSLRTAGGHLRFRSEDVMALLAGRSNPGRPS
jgi:excisionase family DNA binding protein